MPASVQSDLGWLALEVVGPLDFSEVGIIARIANPLGNAGMSVFVVSAHDTDYVLIKAAQADAARSVLTAAGIDVQRAPPDSRPTP